MKSMKNYFYFILTLILTACESKPSFIYLKPYSFKSTQEDRKLNGNYDSYPKGEKIEESILIKNIPSNKIKLKEIMISYFDSLNMNGRLDKKLSKRVVTFYKYSSNTKAFIYSDRDYDGFNRIYLEDQGDDYLGDIIYEKDLENNSKEFTVMYYDKKTDTIK